MHKICLERANNRYLNCPECKVDISYYGEGEHIFSKLRSLAIKRPEIIKLYNCLTAFKNQERIDFDENDLVTFAKLGWDIKTLFSEDFTNFIWLVKMIILKK